jgi:hypothetical protein
MRVKMVAIRSIITRLGWLLALVLLACRQAAPLEPTPTATATAPPPPTATPQPTPTPTPMATPVADVSILYESPQGEFRLIYPAGWVNRRSLFFTLFASAEALLDMQGEVSEGGLVIVAAGRTADFGSSDPATILETGLLRVSPVQDATFVAGPRPLTIGPQAAAEAELTGTSDTGEPLVAYSVAVVYEDRALVLAGITAESTAADYLPIFRDMAASVRLAGAEDAPEENEAETETSVPLTVTGSVGRGQWVAGTIEPHEEEAWQLTAVAGQTIDIVVRPEAGFDVVVDVRDERGQSLLPNGPVDNSFGTERVRQAAIPASGEAYVVVSGFGAAAGSYELYLTPSGVVSGPVAGDVAYGQVVRGRLETADDLALWRFSGQAGDVFDVTVQPLPDELDVGVNVIDPTGLSILPNGAVDEFYDTEYVRGAVLPADGEYLVMVWGFAGTTGPYEIELDLSHNGRYSHSLFAAQPLLPGQAKAHYFTAEAGARLNAFVNPDFDFDVVVRIFDDEDNQLLEVDERFGIEMLTWSAPAAGEYYVQVTGYKEDEAGGYELVLTADPTVQLTLRPGEWLIGDLAAGETAVYTIATTARQRLLVRVEPLSQATAPVLRLLAADGSLIAEGTAELRHTTTGIGQSYRLEVGPVNGRFKLYLERE